MEFKIALIIDFDAIMNLKGKYVDRKRKEQMKYVLNYFILI